MVAPVAVPWKVQNGVRGKIIIPKVFKYSKEVLLMEYIESTSIDKLDNEYSINNILLLLLIFSNNNCLNNISHGDLHKGNWGILDDKLVIYDFGFCFFKINDFS